MVVEELVGVGVGVALEEVVTFAIATVCPLMSDDDIP